MGNSASSSSRGHQDDTVDFGRLTPQGVYTGPKDWNNAIVTQLIIERRLAPFYRPLEEYEETWDDDQILAAMKSPPEAESGHSESSSVRHEPSHANGSKGSHGKRPALAKEVVRCPEAAIYRGAVECPICFLVRYHCYSPYISWLTAQLRSTTHPISTTRDAVTRPSAQNASFKSSGPSLRLHILSPNPRHVHTAYKIILASYIHTQHGELASVAMARSVVFYNTTSCILHVCLNKLNS